MDTVIAASGITKRYRDVVAVDRLDLTIGKGEIYGFLGLNGAGKTTTIRMLLGIIRPDEGSVSLFGNRITPGQKSIWRRVGYMVETPHAYPDLTVRENLDIVRRLRKLDNSGVVDAVMDRLKIPRYADRRAKNLSLGNAQRLGLAKALIHNPDLLVLDEPSNGLDPAGIVEIRNLLKELAEEHGVTIFISSHILTEIARLTTRIGVVHEGRLVKELTAGELEKQEDRRLVIGVRDIETAYAALCNAGISSNRNSHDSLALIGHESIQHPDDIAALLVHAGCPPTRMMVEREDLESYFLNLVGSKGGNGNE
ncbi:MAG: ABC transporter ATP-binding protein [Dehalococcoidales bacterium]|nr:ABC transporter ATP-binding protein [Dehalococcoidales bacterium]